MDKKDIPNRVDFREKTIFTIDGEDAKDLDDAVRVEKAKKRKLQTRSTHSRCKLLCARK